MTDTRVQGFPELVDLLGRSVLVSTVERSLDRALDVSGRSRIVGTVRDRVQTFLGFKAVHRIALVGIFLLAFSAAHLVLMLAVPLRAAPMLPSGIGLLTGTVGLLLLTCSRPLSVAWQTRRQKKNA